MSNDGRACSVSISVASANCEQDDARAAGTFPDRLVGTNKRKPIEPDDREALRRLCEIGKMIRRTDGSYGTAAKRMIINAIATRLKARDLAVSGFNGEMVPTNKGIRLNAEAINA